MRYVDIVKTASSKSEEVMWKQIYDVSDLIDSLWRSHPEIAQRFMMKAYSMLHGDHFNEQLAREFVNVMYHFNAKEEKISGEAVTVEEAEGIIEPMDRSALRWDAYVACNTFMHDLARTGMSRQDIMDSARVFWFEDDDFKGESKVFWYYANK